MTAIVVVFWGVFNHERLYAGQEEPCLLALIQSRPLVTLAYTPGYPWSAQYHHLMMVTSLTWSAQPAPQLTTPMTE